MVIELFIRVKTFIRNSIFVLIIFLFPPKVGTSALDVSLFNLFWHFEPQVQILEFLISEGCELVFSFFPGLIRLLVVRFDFCLLLFVEELSVFFLMLFER
jgi:hypothetical protein